MGTANILLDSWAELPGLGDKRAGLGSDGGIGTAPCYTFSVPFIRTDARTVWLARIGGQVYEVPDVTLRI